VDEGQARDLHVVVLRDDRDAADKTRGNLEASEYKHVVLGLVFLKYISDTFEQRHTYLAHAAADPTSDYFIPDPDRRRLVSESHDEYTAEAVFWVPETARWPYLQQRAKQPDIGVLLDAPMDTISTRRWTPSRRSTRSSAASCPRATPGPRSTSGSWASSSSTNGEGERDDPADPDTERIRGEVARRDDHREGRLPEHFIDLCRMLGEPTPREADPIGDQYAFEQRISKTAAVTASPASGSATS